MCVNLSNFFFELDFLIIWMMNTNKHLDYHLHYYDHEPYLVWISFSLQKKIRSIKIFINPFIFQTLVVILCSCRLGDTFASALWDARVFILFFQIEPKGCNLHASKSGQLSSNTHSWCFSKRCNYFFIYFFRYSQFKNHSLLSNPLHFTTLQHWLHVLMSCFQIEEEKVWKKLNKS